MKSVQQNNTFTHRSAESLKKLCIIFFKILSFVFDKTVLKISHMVNGTQERGLRSFSFGTRIVYIVTFISFGFYTRVGRGAQEANWRPFLHRVQFKNTAGDFF